jgi:hypothetical protein
MNKPKFSKPPLTMEEKQKLSDDFVNFTDKTPPQSSTPANAPLKKEPIKALFLRAPQSYFDDIQQIVQITGLTMNAVCLELLRPAIKKKLKELKED